MYRPDSASGLGACDNTRTLHPNVVLPLVTSLIAFAFCGVLLTRFVERRRPYYFVWTLGLLWYALATASEAAGGALGWNPGLYRLWYLSGAIGVAAYLGAGTVYLHRDPSFGSLTVVCVLGASVPALVANHLDIGFGGLATAILLSGLLSWRSRWFAHAVFAALVLASLVATYRVLNATIDVGLLPASPDQVVSGQALDAETRALTPPFNISGALVLILGAVISAVRFGRSGALPSGVSSNVLIAVGAFVPSVASGLTRFGITSLFFIGELLGLACILAGFLLSGSSSARPSRGPSASAPTGPS
jgi:hypothetical protein